MRCGSLQAPQLNVKLLVRAAKDCAQGCVSIHRLSITTAAQPPKAVDRRNRLVGAEPRNHTDQATNFRALVQHSPGRSSVKRLALVIAVGLASTAAGASAASSDRAPRFDRLDSNADGRLSRKEAAAHSAVAQRFEQLDVNKDGFLSRDELAPKRRGFCDPSEAESQVVKAQSHSSRRTTFWAE